MSAVELSSLNRAALAEEESYTWIHFLALAYCVVIGLFSVVAWLTANEPFRAAVCAGAQILSIIMALLARRGFTGQMSGAGAACVAIAFGFAMWAAQGLQHAWSTNGAQIEEWQVWFLTGSEPAIFLLIEHIKEGRQTLRAAQENEDRETAVALAAARAKDESYRSKPPAQPGDTRQGGEGATVTRLKLVERPAETPATDETNRQTEDTSADQPVDELPRLESPDHSARTFADPEAHARHLITVGGVRQRNELARQVRGLSTYKAGRLLDELAPDWRAPRTSAA